MKIKSVGESPGDNVVAYRFNPDLPLTGLRPGSTSSNTWGREVFQDVRDSPSEETAFWRQSISGELQGTRHFSVVRNFDQKKSAEVVLAFESYGDYWALRVDRVEVTKPKVKLKRSDKHIDLLVYVDLSAPSPEGGEYQPVLRHTFKIKGVPVGKKVEFGNESDYLRSPLFSFPEGFISVLPYTNSVYVMEFRELPANVE